MTDGVSRRRVSHLCSLVRLGTRSREGINSLGISINFVPRLVCRPTTVVRRRKRKRNSADICVEEAYSPSLPFARRARSAHEQIETWIRATVPPSLPGNYHGRRSRAARFTTVREFRQFTTNDWLEKRGRMDSLPAEKGN